MSRAWSCQSLANGAGAAVAIAGMPLQKFNREEIQKRMQDSEFLGGSFTFPTWVNRRGLIWVFPKIRVPQNGWFLHKGKPA